MSALQSLLEAFGATVVGAAATTADATRIASERAPEVALVDVNLRDGERAFDLIERLREQGIFVVVTSGYSHDRLRRIAAEAILEKPIDEAELIAILRSRATRKPNV